MNLDQRAPPIEIDEMRQALAAVGATPGGRDAAAAALEQRLTPLRTEISALAIELAPVLAHLGRAHQRLTALEHRLSALVALAVATGRHDHADDPTEAAMATLQADSGWDRLLGQLADGGVEPR